MHKKSALLPMHSSKPDQRPNRIHAKENAPSWAHLHLHAVRFVNMVVFAGTACSLDATLSLRSGVEDGCHRARSRWAPRISSRTMSCPDGCGLTGLTDETRIVYQKNAAISRGDFVGGMGASEPFCGKGHTAIREIRGQKSSVSGPKGDSSNCPPLRFGAFCFPCHKSNLALLFGFTQNETLATWIVQINET